MTIFPHLRRMLSAKSFPFLCFFKLFCFGFSNMRFLTSKNKSGLKDGGKKEKSSLNIFILVYILNMLKKLVDLL